MDNVGLIGVIGVLLAGVQIWLAIRADQRASKRSSKTPPPSTSTFVISKKRFYWILGTFVLTLSMAGISFIHPRSAIQFDNNAQQLEDIHDRHYVSEVIDLDGKSYRHCTFDNVKFRFQGKATFVLSDNVFTGNRVLYTDNPVVAATFELVKGFGGSPGVPIFGPNMEPNPNIKEPTRNP